jgi:hypothetical protein
MPERPTGPDFTPVIEGLEPYRASVAKESDRGAVLVTHAIIDEKIAELASAYLPFGSATARDRLLKSPLGAISTFSSRLDFLACSGYLTPDIYSDLRLFNKLRNQCAHSWASFTIDQPLVTKYLRPMHIYEAVVVRFDEALGVKEGARALEKLSPRAVFNVVAAMLAHFMHLHDWAPPPEAPPTDITKRAV